MTQFLFQNPERYSDHEDLDEGWRSEDGAEDDMLNEDLDYEPSPKPNRPKGNKARTINIYRNGDSHFPAKQVAVSHKSLESLYVFLNDKYPVTGGVKFLLSVPDGKVIQNISDIEEGGSYAMSPTRSLKKNINYEGIKSSQWNNRKPSGGLTRSFRKAELPLIQKDPPRDGTPGTLSLTSTPNSSFRSSSKPRVLIIVKNTDREIQEKVILNLQTSQSYEEILVDITNMLHFPDDDPVIGLYTLRPPHRMVSSLRWRHNEHDSVSNHQPHDCLLNHLFGRWSKKTSKLRVTGLCVGNSPGTGEFPAQMASNAENVSIWWRLH